jgi:Zn-dependent protease
MLEKSLMITIAEGSLAVILHELAHVVAASALRVRLYQIGITWRGPFIRRDPGTVLQNLAITLAGPGTNLLLAFLLHRTNPVFSLSNLVLGITNLLPFPSSDGSRALCLLRTIREEFASASYPAQDYGREEPTALPGDDLRDEAA